MARQQPDYAAQLALFLLEKKGSIFATWSGKMRAADQRRLFGTYLGRFRLVINGGEETVCVRVMGRDCKVTRWGEL